MWVGLNWASHTKGLDAANLVTEYGAECGEIKLSLRKGTHIKKKKKSRQIETNTDEQNKDELTRGWLLSEPELSVCGSSPGMSADLLSLIY